MPVRADRFGTAPGARVEYVAAVILLVVGLVGIVLTLATLSGYWLVLLVALACQWWQPGLFSWWTLGACAAMCVAAEVFEITASAAGTAKRGGGKAAAGLSIVGALFGALSGSMVFPIVGTVVGAVVGAGVGAVLGERGFAARSWKESLGVGYGAATGRALAVVVKAAIAVVVVSVLVIGAVV